MSSRRNIRETSQKVKGSRHAAHLFFNLPSSEDKAEAVRYLSQYLKADSNRVFGYIRDKLTSAGYVPVRLRVDGPVIYFRAYLLFFHQTKHIAALLHTWERGCVAFVEWRETLLTLKNSLPPSAATLWKETDCAPPYLLPPDCDPRTASAAETGLAICEKFIARNVTRTIL